MSMYACYFIRWTKHDLVIKCCNVLRALNNDEAIVVFKYIQSNCKYREDVLT